MAGSAQDDVQALAQRMRLNAATFIVTIYGDIVVPRDGVLWTGSLIALCDRVGINESLVRTALSRLAAAQQLAGERIGRRSYYRLQPVASATFMAAADLLYGPDRPAAGWQILYDPALRPEEALRQRMGHMGGQVFIRPDRGQAVPAGAVLFRGEAATPVVPVADFWDLAALSQGYADFMQLFDGLDPAGLDDADALTARLLLVHAYRFVLLRDPRLPPAHLPSGWNAAPSRALFRRTYDALTPAAHRWIAAVCEGADGPLPADTAATVQRSLTLQQQS